MKYFHFVRCASLTIGSLLVFISTVFAFDSISVYRFERDERCIAIYNFQEHREEIISAGKERMLELVGLKMIADYFPIAKEDCLDKEFFFLLATYIPGVDNYGRPDFSSKTNIISLTGAVKDMLEISRILEDDSFGNSVDVISKLALKRLLKVEKFEE